MFDVLLRGGRVIDGTGGPWYPADVAIRDGQIGAVGRLPGAAAAAAATEYDATGLAVAPGFIDIHDHSDLSLVTAPSERRLA
jgi:N-acyl-D-amino-acid deacylase